MNNDLVEFERARAHWWQIYCKCRQIVKVWEDDIDKKKTVSVTDMQELGEPCETARKITQELLWSYLNRENGQNAGVKITSVWLWAYFGHQLLDSETLGLYQSGQRFTVQEQLEFYQRGSTFFLQLLKEVQMDVPEENRNSLRLEGLEGISYIQFARSLIFLLSEYCHLDVNMSRVLDVETHLREAILSDAYLYSTKERYRDHIFHVVDVCLLGLFLLHCRLSQGQTILALVSKLIHGDANGEDSVIQNWFLAALFHDIGYSLEAEEQRKKEFQLRSGEQEPPEDEWQRMMKIEERNIHRRNLAELELRKARYGENNFPLHLIYDIDAEREEIRRLEAQLEHWSTRKIARPTAPKTETKEETGETVDHGERSYEYVKRILKTLPSDNGSILERFKPALRAIKKHNLMEKKIAFSKEPLSCLLVLCDELQEWGRARVDVLEFREAMVSKIIFPDPGILPTNRLLEYLFVNVKLDQDGKCGTILDRTLDFRLYYRDATKEQFEPLAIWLLKSYNLQRVQITGSKLNISVTMRNPICEELRRFDSSDVCEFSILKDFMRDRRKWRELEDWIDNENFVKWEIERGNEPDARIENITLHLNKGAELLHGNPVKIFEELFEWRRDYIKGKRRKL